MSSFALRIALAWNEASAFAYRYAKATEARGLDSLVHAEERLRCARIAAAVVKMVESDYERKAA